MGIRAIFLAGGCFFRCGYFQVVEGSRRPVSFLLYLIVADSAGIGLFFDASPSRLYCEDVLIASHSFFEVEVFVTRCLCVMFSKS